MKKIILALMLVSPLAHANGPFICKITGSHPVEIKNQEVPGGSEIQHYARYIHVEEGVEHLITMSAGANSNDITIKIATATIDIVSKNELSIIDPIVYGFKIRCTNHP